MDYLTVEEAIHAPGLRLVLTAGVPGPWGEAAKAMLSYKGLAYTPVRQMGGEVNEALQTWTGQNSAPVLVPESGPSVSHWMDLLLQCEELAPAKPLLPRDVDQRAMVLGLSALLAGVNGFAWNRRLQMFAPAMRLESPPEVVARMAYKYGWSEAACAQAPARMREICDALDSRLQKQEQVDSGYLVGASVTAVDFYWANFAGMIKPLAHADNPMPSYMRETYQARDRELLDCVTPRLQAHRDMMYQHHITLPLDF
ncbi:MAG: hypothetical protein HOC23_21475 [Halieaceae bacterium]|jgi:glutathione S-transferase|nr:hypothetical protein [Halieaceae bacterium]